MDTFPRTTVGGVSLSRLIIGTNWFLGWSHTSAAKDALIRTTHTRGNIADAVAAFMEYGVDTVMGPLHPLLMDALAEAEDRVGRRVIRIYTPTFNILPTGPRTRIPSACSTSARRRARCFCMPHQCVTDALLDRMHGVIRDIGRYTALIRERGMIPGFRPTCPKRWSLPTRRRGCGTYLQIYKRRRIPHADRG